MMGDGLKNMCRQRTLILPADHGADLAFGLTAVHEIGPPGYIDYRLGQGFVQRHERIAVSYDPGFFAQRFAQRLPDAYRRVFDGVMRIDVDIAFEIGRASCREGAYAVGSHV